MTKLNEIYKCEICGNIVELVHTGVGQLVCCGKPMILQTENTVDAVLEKHVPVIEKIDGKIKIQVGSVEHPMEEVHFIEWIEYVTENKIYRQHLKPGDKPIAEFETTEDGFAREYCNLHGLWRSH